jgi:hypothetical protein
VRRRFTTIASYGWNAVRMTDRAFVALWPAGDVVADVSPQRTRHARFAYVADYGFAGEAGLADFARLLDDARQRACSGACTHAVAYTCDASPGQEVLAAGADFDDRMFLTLAAPEPESLSQTGVYVDSFFA